MEAPRPRLRPRLSSGPLALLLAVACAAQVPDDDCMGCHEGDKPVVDRPALAGSIHSGLGCVDCHVDVKDLPHAENLAKVSCAQCHEAQAKEFEGSIHADLARKGVPDMPVCTSCHGTHAIYGKTDLRSIAGQFQVDHTCSGCHAKKEITDRHLRMPSPEFVNRYQSSVHGRGVHLKGLVVSATCSDCHGAHGILPGIDPSSSVHRNAIPTTCSRCHVGIFQDWEKSAHGKAWSSGGQKGPVCTDCHKAHGVGEALSGAFQLKMAQECGGCHEKEASSYGDTFHGQSTSLGYVVAAQCSDCHTPHRNLPKEDPESTVHPANLIATCGKCHPGANANFVQYDPHLDPHDKGQSALVYWVNLLMTWLLLGTFSFWGLHTFLWLQRAIIGVARKEITKPVASGKYVRRFSRAVIVTHIVIVVSFLGLVATGIPLRYHYTAWAKGLGAILGGVEVARYFHRVFAIATFGYAAWHLGFVAWHALVKRKLGLLWGPESLVPRWKDVVDFKDNFRWFLYLGKPPRYGRWTYFEKFDYFAVFWGIPVIGLSGLVLWFPAFFAKFLPGTAFSVATIVHGEEALLAAGFIFTFHFFHNHLRPENFPMDVSVFTGKVPLERFEHERPEEYEAAVKDGKLEALMEEAPLQATMWKSRLFGLIALLVGLALVLSVFATYVAG